MKIDYSFVRNQCYTRNKVDNLDRHNERKNKSYSNSDVEVDRIPMNIHYKSCEGTYLSAFDRMVEDGTISTWNLKPDSKIVDEFVFDINTEYFDRHGAGNPGGGYEYAKQFYEDVYRFAVREVGGENYILSAVMHADERNKALSEQLGRDVYHYHLHVMYIPVVDKEIRWTKRCKDPALVGTVKSVVKQVSNSKKWESEKVIGEDGKQRLIYSYSMLQDRFHQHMLSAGYDDVERGQRGSATEHLDVLDYKIQQDTQRAAGLEQDTQAKQKQVSDLNKRLAVRTKIGVTYQDIDGLARRSKSGKIILEPEDWETVSGMAKIGVVAIIKTEDLQKLLTDATAKATRNGQAYDRLFNETIDYRNAVRVAPEQTQAALESVLQQQREHQQLKQQRSSSHSR